jgi:hypothetical protein
MARKTTRRPEGTGEETEVQFVLGFDGPAVETGRMDAKVFAPSLFATASLVESAAEALFERGDSVSVQVNADFKRGSFVFDLAAVVVMAGQTVIQNLSISDIDTMLQWLGLRGKREDSLLRYLLHYGGKKIERIEPAGPGSVSVHIQGDNNTVVILPEQVVRLLENSRVRDNAYEALLPLKVEGITDFRVGAEKKNADLVIQKADLPKFVPPPPPKSKLTDSNAETAVELLSPSFVEGNKWRVSQGGEPFWATITDETFLKKVDEGEPFAKGDYLVVEMTTQTFRTPSGLEATREITHVIRHERRGKQQSLF